jgi:dienelactone hydrolase
MQRAMRRKIGVFVLAAAIVLLFRPAGAHVRAASLLARFSEASADTQGVTERALEVPVGFGAGASSDGGAPKLERRARLYLPAHPNGAPGIVLLHGVHRLGIDEPRLVRFARTIAAAGVVVLTPEIAELTDYHVDPRSVDTIGFAARALKDEVHRPSVGVMGMSFAGGLALLTAADPRFAADVGFVVAVGAHDDLERVSRYFATSHIEDPDGHASPIKPHEYGPLVLVYDHAQAFFSPEDVPLARDALRLWLWEKKDDARATLPRLSAPAREKMGRLFDGKFDAIAAELLTEIDRGKDEAARVSPHGHLAELHAPVFLLHGAGDSVIPATETAWLARDAPNVKDVLVSPAVVHVELGEPSFADKVALIHFLADVLAEAERT